MSEKFEQKRITIGEEALKQNVSKNQPFEHKKSVIDSSQKEFKKTSHKHELFEGSPYVDKKEYQQDLVDETLNMAKDTIAKLLYKQEMAGASIEKNSARFDQIQRIVERKNDLEQRLRDLEMSGQINTPQYNAIENQYEDALRRFNNLESIANTPDGNLIDANEEVIKIEKQILEKEEIIEPKYPELN
jgi:ATP-dependent protease HslVU (ClpYQ) peptidase subunit